MNQTFNKISRLGEVLCFQEWKQSSKFPPKLINNGE
jgi:hypothetical protein